MAIKFLSLPGSQAGTRSERLLVGRSFLFRLHCEGFRVLDGGEEVAGRRLQRRRLDPDDPASCPPAADVGCVPNDSKSHGA